VQVTVSDTGIGIPAEKQRLIFSAFEQADTSSTRRYGGTGLGLTISAHLVEYMGGRLWVDSEVDRGSHFHFTARFEIARDAPRDPAPLRHALTGSRVLIVDDNATNRKILAKCCATGASWLPKQKTLNKRWRLAAGPSGRPTFFAGAERCLHA
jgi:two-component system, sensor histidine kinase and response regulator